MKFNDIDMSDWKNADVNVDSLSSNTQPTNKAKNTTEYLHILEKQQ
ncbi:MAG: hypothetical protein LBL74_03650 [Bacteroidales bacterium]|jgi:hypothetical protein|nr:hypothetical protein [Bacteroidales bacterium]